MALVTKGPKVPDEVAAILSYYDSATEVQRVAGRRWYAEAGTLCRSIADTVGVEHEAMAHVIAALSPRNPWRWNLFDAYSFGVAFQTGQSMPKATTFKRNQLRAWQALSLGQAAWSTSALKVRNFVAAILGDETAVVIDTWAVRAATFGRESMVRTDKRYTELAHAYNVAANLRGETPRDMQAIVWIVAQTEGLASLRRGRHDLSFKAGTPAWLVAAVSIAL